MRSRRIYSLSSVIITYEMSRKIANTSWLQMVFSGLSRSAFIPSIKACGK